jgi:hypothetical protein
MEAFIGTAAVPSDEHGERIGIPRRARIARVQARQLFPHLHLFHARRLK